MRVKLIATLLEMCIFIQVQAMRVRLVIDAAFRDPQGQYFHACLIILAT